MSCPTGKARLARSASRSRQRHTSPFWRASPRHCPEQIDAVANRCLLEVQFDGPVEGACRHLVKDRMGITGARWGLEGAEAVLRLRALVTNGDFDAYWRFHLSREQERVHLARYAPDVLPVAA